MSTVIGLMAQCMTSDYKLYRTIRSNRLDPTLVYVQLTVYLASRVYVCYCVTRVYVTFYLGSMFVTV